MMRRVAGASAVVAALLLGGCAAMGAPDERVTAGAPVEELRIGLTEWTIVTGDAVAAPGEVTLEVTNTGGTSHDLEVVGERGSWITPELPPGESTTLRIETVAGERLELVCTLPGHGLSGMRATLPVAAGDER